MAVYAIGDVQGCYESLNRLLEKMRFDPAADQLRFAGDLINRGPASLATLRLIRSLGDAAVSVLGNHDLHALAVFLGGLPKKKKDTLCSLYDAADAEELFEWLRHCPLALWDASRQVLISHAGIPPQWSVEKSLSLSGEIESVLQSKQSQAYFQAMYGNEPAVWDDELTGTARWRLITNYFTRMRFIDSRGCLDLVTKEGLDKAPDGFRPWFSFPREDNITILFGHWAALMGVTGHPERIALDTGCVWGGRLRAINLDTRELIETDAVEPAFRH